MRRYGINISSNGILATSQFYSWSAFAEKYIQLIDNLYKKREEKASSPVHRTPYGKKLARAKLFIISDLDGTLIEGKNAPGLKEFAEWVKSNNDKVAFGIATGRNRYITQQALTEYNLPSPDILICSAGSEIYYTDQFISDKGWESHINYQWKRSELQQALSRFPHIRLQEQAAQWPFKLSYYVDESFNEDTLANLYKYLDDHKLRAKILLTENKFLDLLPFRASKGSAVHYLSYKWKSHWNNSSRQVTAVMT